jgi:hypothetical protein
MVGFALALVTSAQATPRPTLPQPDSLLTQVREDCGPGMVRREGRCVAREDVRRDRREERRCRQWVGGVPGGVCTEWE